ncbi:MAG: hypothetical protein ACC628_09200, partial [Pirellulaceae bacterium]
LRPDDSVLASHSHTPGAWRRGPDAQELNSPGSFSYTGDGAGPVRIRLSTTPEMTGHFAGAIDNLQVDDL